MSPKVRGAARVAIVAALALFYCVTVVIPAMSVLWYTPGTFGMELSGRTVAQVDPGSSAQHAGLRPGDTIAGDLSTSDRVRLYMQHPPPGEKLTLHVQRGRATRIVTLEAQPDPYSISDAFLVFLNACAYLAILLFGASIILMHPSLMTWGFGLFCITALAPTTLAQAQLAGQPPLVWVAVTGAQTILYNVGAIGFLIFAFRFPGDVARDRWRAIVLRYTPVLVLACVTLDSINMIQWSRGTYQNWIDYLEYGLYVAIFVLSGAALVETYLRSSGSDRSRLHWALLGVGVGYALFIVNNIGYELNVLGGQQWAQALISVSGMLEIVVPIAVGYAILRHRVIDVRFVVDQAVVYAATTAIVVSTIALLHWFVGKRLESAHMEFITEVIFALLLGWTLSRIHDWMDELAKRVLFRSWYEAVKRLEGIGEALRFAESEQSVDGLIVSEPVDALHLISAATFHRVSDGAYGIGKSIGWDAAAISIDADHPLVLQLQARGAPVRMAEVRALTEAPRGALAPVLAIPLRSRHEVFGFVLYGGHTNGAELNPHDVETLTKLADEAASAYESIALAERRREIERLRAQVDTLKSLLMLPAPDTM
jgi:hypothetical protein